MRSKKNLVTVACVGVFVAALYFFIKPEGKQQSTIISLERVIRKKLTPFKQSSDSKIDNAYCLIQQDDSLVILTENGNFIADSNFIILREFSIPAEGTIYHLRKPKTPWSISTWIKEAFLY